MVFGTFVPRSARRSNKQNDTTDVDDEFYASLFEKPNFLPIHRVWQVLSFFIFFGPIKVFLAAITALLWAGVMSVLPMARKFFKTDIEFKRWSHSIMRQIVRLFLMFLGVIRIDIEGDPTDCTRIFASNSVTILDYLIHFCSTPITIVSENKEDLDIEKIIAGQVFDVFKLKAKKNVCHQIANAVSDPSYAPLLVFPESTMTNGDAVLAFRDSLFQNDYPAQPVAIQYFMGLTPRGFNSLHFDIQKWFYCVLQFLAIPFITVKLTYLHEIKNVEDATLKAKMAQMNIAHTLGSLAISRAPWIRGRRNSRSGF